MSPGSSRKKLSSDPYFVDRKLYPNVDFYSGIIMRAIGIPTNMFTVMFAIGRMPGWIAQWKEQHADGKLKIARPRQIYIGNRADRVRADRQAEVKLKLGEPAAIRSSFHHPNEAIAVERRPVAGVSPVAARNPGQQAARCIRGQIIARVVHDS